MNYSLKIIFCFIVSINILFCCIGCTNISNQNNATDSATLNPDYDNKFKTVMYTSDEDNMILNIKHNTKFDTKEYSNPQAPDSIDITIQNVTYHALYENSAILPHSDFSVNVYKIKNTSDSRIFIDAETNDIIKYINIPFSGDLINESDYIDFIKNFTKDYNLSNYNYECQTRCNIFSEGWIEGTTKDGFYYEDESTKVVMRFFYYTHSINSLKTDNHISAIFNTRKNTFTLEIYDIDYESNMIEPLENSIKDLNNHLESYLKSNIKSNYVFSSYDIIGQKVFVKDNIPYILSTLQIEFCHSDDFFKKNKYVAPAQLITCMN